MGIWVALLPFLGFPVDAKRVLFLLTGIVIFIAAYLYLRKRVMTTKDRVEPTFVEAMPTSQKSHSGSLNPNHPTKDDVATE